MKIMKQVGGLPLRLQSASERRHYGQKSECSGIMPGHIQMIPKYFHVFRFVVTGSDSPSTTPLNPIGNALFHVLFISTRKARRSSNSKQLFGCQSDFWLSNRNSSKIQRKYKEKLFTIRRAFVLRMWLVKRVKNAKNDSPECLKSM